MSPALRGWLLCALTAALLTSTATARAQDALGSGADLEDSWEAILNAAPPSVAATDPALQRKGRRGEGGASDGTRAERRSRRERDSEGSSTSRRERDSEGSSTAMHRSADRASHRAASQDRADERKESRKRATAEEDDARRARKERRERAAERKRREREERRAKEQESKGVTSGYADLKRSWHAPWPEEEKADALTTPPVLMLHPVGRAATPSMLSPQGADGGFDEEQVAIASKAFGSWSDGPKVSPRLLDLIYHAALHFGVFHVHLVSGVRRDRTGSRHSHGLAADIVLPGVEDEELAAYFRAQGFVGVGVYTRAGFVHVDVRERSYFWLDKSPPGRRYKIIPQRAAEARQADADALARGQTVFVNPPRLQKALHARQKRRVAQAKAAQ